MLLMFGSPRFEGRVRGIIPGSETASTRGPKASFAKCGGGSRKSPRSPVQADRPKIGIALVRPSDRGLAYDFFRSEE
jgi:hypothetical protein